MIDYKLTYSLVRYSFYVILFLLTYILHYNQVFSGYPSDFGFHISSILDIVNGNKVLSHPLFHYLVYFISYLFPISINISAILLNSILIVLTGVSTHYILNINLKKNQNKYFILFIVFVVLFSGTLFLEGLNLTKYQYVGNSAISIWHNVTINTVMPLSIYCFFMFFNIFSEKIKKYDNKTIFFSLIIALISIFAKPSFIVIYFPTLILFVLYIYVIKKEKNKVLLTYVITLVILSILSLTFQAYVTYGGENKVIIAPFKVWMLHSDNVLISIVLTNLFVFVFSLFGYKFLSTQSIFSIIML